MLNWFRNLVRSSVRAELDQRDGELRALTDELWDVYRKLRMCEKRLWAAQKGPSNGKGLEVDDGDLNALLRSRKGL